MSTSQPPRFQLTPHFYNRILPHLTRELERQTLIHKRVARLNMLYYTSLHTNSDNPRYIPYLWTMLLDAIDQAVMSGDIVEYYKDPHWIYLPHQSPNVLDRCFERKSRVLGLWAGRASREAAGHAEQVLRSIFAHCGHQVVETKFQIADLSTGEACLPDLYTVSPRRIALEVKNITSDVLIDPRHLVGKQERYTKIDRHFRLCSVNGVHPVLIAPRIDASFDSYEKRYKGLHCEMMYQLMPSHHAILCTAVKRDLLFEHLVAVDTQPPFPPELQPLIDWVQRLPDLLTSYG